jgi:hypothetical protein
MKKLSLLLMFLLMVPVLAQEGPGLVQIAQWASDAEASSQYGDPAYSAMQATGEPDVLECSDSENAWASLDVTGEETLTVYFDEAVTPTQVNIYQSYNPGAITGIEIIPAVGTFAVPIPDSADDSTGCLGVFSVDLPEGLPESNGVRITLDQTRVGDWNEIDAVELVGTRQGEASETMPSSLQANTFSRYTSDAPQPATTESAQPSKPTVPKATVAPDQTQAPQPTQAAPPPTQPAGLDFGGEWGYTVDCGSYTIQNGLDLTIVQQRSGSRYRVTALGINGFDPVLAVLDASGRGLCNDDEANAASYSASLPTTGLIQPSSTSSQVTFDNNSTSAFEDVKIVVGGYEGMAGEFIVIVEGMLASSADGVGDPFSLYVSPALMMSGVDPTAYMISVTTVFDPTIYMIDGDYNYIQDNAGNLVACDDAGNASLCFNTGFDLSRSYVSRTQGNLPGGQYDAMITLSPGDEWGYYYNYAMSSYGGTYGDYIAVFHLGIGERP